MIYFMQSINGGPIKIGYSEDVDRRRLQLEAHYGQPLAVLGLLPGGRDEEQALHAQFAHLRFGRTEQFQPAFDLMAFIGRPLLVGANTDLVEAMVGGADRVTIVNLKGTAEYKAWLDRLSEHCHMPASNVYDVALAEFAERKGFYQPPRRQKR